MNAIFVTHFVPRDVGNGGHHRAYQIQHDLQRVVGHDHATVLSFPQWKEHTYTRPPSGSRMSRYWDRRRRQVKHWIENPIRLLSNTTFSPRQYSVPQFLSFYEDLIKGISRPDVCIIEDAGFAGIVSINRQHDILTFICPQNLESLDLGPLFLDAPWHLNARTYDLANELQVLRSCQERLFISRTEAGFVGGLGLSSHFYPYRPVGAIAKHLLGIREQRSAQEQEAGLFLLLGSAGHRSTREAFLWFVQQAKEHRLPSNIRIIATGSRTDTLLPPGEKVPGLELHGWIKQNALDEWLVRAQAALAPQHRGFGALTRLSELSCAGIPVITSRHTTYAIDLPPGVWAVEDNWDAWLQAMQGVAVGQEIAESDYMIWYKNQPSTLESVMRSTFGLSPSFYHALPSSD